MNHKVDSRKLRPVYIIIVLITYLKRIHDGRMGTKLGLRVESDDDDLFIYSRHKCNSCKRANLRLESNKIKRNSVNDDNKEQWLSRSALLISLEATTPSDAIPILNHGELATLRTPGELIFTEGAFEALMPYSRTHDNFP